METVQNEDHEVCYIVTQFHVIWKIHSWRKPEVKVWTDKELNFIKDWSLIEKMTLE